MLSTTTRFTPPGRRETKSKDTPSPETETETEMEGGGGGAKTAPRYFGGRREWRAVTGAAEGLRTQAGEEDEEAVVYGISLKQPIVSSLVLNNHMVGI